MIVHNSLLFFVFLMQIFAACEWLAAMLALLIYMNINHILFFSLSCSLIIVGSPLNYYGLGTLSDAYALSTGFSFHCHISLKLYFLLPHDAV